MKPKRRYLLPARKRVGIKELDLARHAHFHHLAEIARLSFDLNARYRKGLEKLRMDRSGDVQIFRMAGSNPNLNHLILERNHWTVEMLLDIAGINSKPERKVIHRIAEGVIREQKLAELDNRIFLTNMADEVEKELGKHNAVVVKKAISDWMKARTQFRETRN